MRATLHSIGALTCAAVLGAAATTASATAPAIYQLGTLGGTKSFGFGVNDAGQVAGYSYLSGDSAFHAFRYDGIPGSGGVMRDLGTIISSHSQGMGINISGQVAGQSDATISGTTIVADAMRYDGTPGSGGVMRNLGSLGPNGSSALGVNTSGQVAGITNMPDGITGHAFRYDGTPGSSGVMRNLGTLGGNTSQGEAINNAGQVAGYSDFFVGSNAVHRAFRYDGTPGSGGIMHPFGTLGGTFSGAHAINNLAQVAGDSTLSGDTVTHAFRYDGTPGTAGVMRNLGTLGGTTASAEGINDSAKVVGNSKTAGNVQHAFIYLGTPGAGGAMIDLDTWLDANNPAEGAKWTLTDAHGISNSNWITGTGTYDPDGPGGTAPASRAFLLDGNSIVVPEPASVGLLALAAVALRRGGRGRRG